MKRIVFVILVVVIGTAGVQAQSGKSKAGQQKTTKAKRAKTDAAAANKADTSHTVSLVSTSANQAYGAVGANRLSIADPVVNIFRQRARNSPVTFNGKDVIGMPGSTYGIANGRILLRGTTATTPGTNYGSGAVGTGTTLLGVGASENAISVNGKSPYAGPWLWGGKLPSVNLVPFLKDSTRRDQ